MSKLIIYATNLGVVPKNLSDIVTLAKSKKKLRITEVDDTSYLASVEAGDNIITSKGNNVYIVEIYDGALAELPAGVRETINNLYRNYGLKESNISKVTARVKYGTWCKDAADFAITKSKTTKSSSKSMNFKNFYERVKAAMLPQEVNDVRIAFDGNICVETANGYVAIDDNYQLTAYPEALAVPMFTVAKSIDQVVPGDIIAREKSYVKVKSVKDGRITAVGYTGRGAEVYPIKDFFLGQATVRVVISPAANLNGDTNFVTLMAFSKDKDFESVLPYMFMNQKNGTLVGNQQALAMMALADGGDFNFKDILMYSAFSGNQNPFANLFGTSAPSNPGITVAPTAPAEEANDEAPAAE